MVKKKLTRKTARRAAPRRVYRSRRAKSGTQYIPAAMATVGLVAANIPQLKVGLKNIQSRGAIGAVNHFVNDGAYKKYIEFNALKKDAIYYAGGYLAGEAIRRYAPKMIKAPLGKLAKKIPRV